MLGKEVKVSDRKREFENRCFPILKTREIIFATLNIDGVNRKGVRDEG